MMRNWFLILLFGGLFVGCDGDSKSKQKTPVKATEPVIETPTFQADSAYQYVQNQVDFGPRVPNSKGHADCAQYFTQFFNRTADTLYRQQFTATAFDGTKLNGINFIASFNPKSTKRIILAAHWDTRPFADRDVVDTDQPILGANDGASGVGVLMEIARIMHKQPPSVGVDIILFDAEDYGKGPSETFCLGSQYWSANPHLPNYKAHYGILLDMVGAKGSTFMREGHSVFYAGTVVDKVWKEANKLGYGQFFKYDRTPEITDDHYFVNSIAKIPMIDIIHRTPLTLSGFGRYWHTHNDNMSVIDPTTLSAVGQTVTNVVYKEK